MLRLRFVCVVFVFFVRFLLLLLFWLVGMVGWWQANRGDAMDDELVSRCGYCGDVIDYCQGHGDTERAEYGFDYDSDEYEARRDLFESYDLECYNV